jgi:hypothetical protein
VCDVTFHDLGHDFSHRAQEEVAYCVEHVTKKGPPAMDNVTRYRQGLREDDPGASSSGS